MATPFRANVVKNLLISHEEVARGATSLDDVLYWSTSNGVRRLTDTTTAYPNNPFEGDTEMVIDWWNLLGEDTSIANTGEIANDGEFLYVLVTVVDFYDTFTANILKLSLEGTLVSMTGNLSSGEDHLGPNGSGLDIRNGFVYATIGSASNTWVSRFPLSAFDGVAYGDPDLDIVIGGLPSSTQYSLAVSTDNSIWLLAVGVNEVLRYSAANWGAFSGVTSDAIEETDSYVLNYPTSEAVSLSARGTDCLVGCAGSGGSPE